MGSHTTSTELTAKVIKLIQKSNVAVSNLILGPITTSPSRRGSTTPIIKVSLIDAGLKLACSQNSTSQIIYIYCKESPALVDYLSSQAGLAIKLTKLV